MKRPIGIIALGTLIAALTYNTAFSERPMPTLSPHVQTVLAVSEPTSSVIDAVSDDETITEIGEQSPDLVRVLPSANGGRAIILLRNPLTLPPELLGRDNGMLLKQYRGGVRQGPTVHWPKELPAYLALLSTGPTDWDFASEPEVLGWEVNGVNIDVHIERDYLTEADGNPDLAGMLMLMDLLGQLPGVTGASSYIDERNPNTEHPFVLLTEEIGDDASLAIVDIPENSKTGITASEGVDGGMVMAGIDGIAGNGYGIHAWPDNVQPYLQRAVIYPDVLRDADGKLIDYGWYAEDWLDRGEDNYVQNPRTGDIDLLNTVIRDLWEHRNDN